MPALLAALLLAAKGPITVAVMPFDNRTGAAENDVLEKGLADMILTDLSSAQGLTIVERSRLNDVISELKLQRSALFDATTVQRVGKLVGASHLVTGQMLEAGAQLRLDVRLVELGSGKVLSGANVAGQADRLFDLEQELVTRFLDGLGKKGVLPSRSGPAKLETLLAYSQALAQVDSGDLKQAQAALAAVMKSDSDFRLAKERYADLLKRLREAGARREEALSAGEQELLATIDARLSAPLDSRKERDVEVYLGYRSMRANFALMRLRKLMGPPSVPSLAKQVCLVKKSLRPEARPLLKNFYDGWMLLLTEAERLNEGTTSTPDHQRANELGLGDHSESLHTGWWGMVELADFVFTGETRNYDVLRKMSPIPAVIEPALVEPALALYAKAGAMAAADKNNRLESMSHVALAHGAALLALGRKEEAMARWQAALDEMPTSPKYKDIEERIEKALGVHAHWKSLDAALKGPCEQSGMTAFMTAGFQLYAYDAEGLFTKAETFAKQCRKPAYPALPAAGFMAIAYAAATVGDCPRWARAAAAAKKIDKATGKQLEEHAAGCVEFDR